MTPEERNKMEELIRQVDSLTKLVADMQNPATVSPDFSRVLNRNILGPSAKASGSENQVVNESGAATYSVLKAPDGFDEVLISGVTHYLPYYT